MRITLAVALVAISGSFVLAQESSQIGTVLDEVAGEVSTASVIVGEEVGTIVPVVYQSGTVGGGAVGGSGSRTIQGAVVTEPSSVVSGEVIQSAPVYSDGVPVEGGTVVSDGGGVITGAPAADCGCGSPAPATYSSAPIEYSAPAADPCCNQPRRGFFRRLFGFGF